VAKVGDIDTIGKSGSLTYPAWTA